LRAVLSDVVSGKTDVDALEMALDRATIEQTADLIALTASYRDSAVVRRLVEQIWRGTARHIAQEKQRAAAVNISAAAAVSRLEGPCAGCYALVKSALVNADLSVRRTAALAMATLGSSHDVPALVQLIVDDDVTVAQSAAAAVSSIQGKEAIDTFRTLLANQSLSADKRDVLEQTIAGVERRQRFLEGRR
jgi:hypothetical protein